MEVIPFNKPYICNDELTYIQDAMSRGHLSGNGYYTESCQDLLQKKFGFNKTLLTHSCTAALEMAALLTRVSPGDEVIIPSFSYVSVANAFALRGANIVLADSYPDHPNIDPATIEPLISPRTKVLVIVHYAGVACDMEKIMALVKKYDLFLVEDCAHAIGATYRDVPLGSFGQLSTFSFHETKNIHCGQGGMLVVNEPGFIHRAEVIWEKGTDRSAFYRGETDRYSWVDIGSSFQMSELNAAFLWGQLQHLEEILEKRMHIWAFYRDELYSLPGIKTCPYPAPEAGTKHNAHIFYLIFDSEGKREEARLELLSQGIQAIFHYTPLHLSKMCEGKYSCPNAENIAGNILRLPLFIGLSDRQQKKISDSIRQKAIETAQ